jgi:hypothetical protein
MVAHIDAQFRIGLGAIQLAAFSVRIYGHWQNLQAGKIRSIEGKLSIALRKVAGLAGITLLGTYLIRPEGILWASVPLPELIRWFGVGAGAVGIAVLALVHRTSGRNSPRASIFTPKAIAWSPPAPIAGCAIPCTPPSTSFLFRSF